MPVPMLYSQKFASLYSKKFLKEEMEKENDQTKQVVEATNWSDDALVAAVLESIAASKETASSSRGERRKTRARFL